MKRTLALWVGIVLLVGAVASAGQAWPPVWGWRSQVVIGTVTAVNAQNNTITVQTTIGWFPTTVTLTVDPSAQIVRHFSTPLLGLKVGDQIEVSGLPLTIQAAKLRASTPPPATTTPAGDTGGTPSAGSAATAPPQVSAKAYAVGTVKSVDLEKGQVVVVLADGKTEVTVTVPADLKVERRDVVKLADVQVGDTAHARVRPKAIGQVVVVALEVWEAPAPAATPSTGGTTTEAGGTTG